MTKCNNCSNPAEFLTDDPSARPQAFCKACLPWHLKKRAELGLLRNPNAEPPRVEVPVVEEAPAPKRKKKAAEPVVETVDPVVEEIVVEDAPAEEPEEA